MVENLRLSSSFTVSPSDIKVEPSSLVNQALSENELKIKTFRTSSSKINFSHNRFCNPCSSRSLLPEVYLSSHTDSNASAATTISSSQNPPTSIDNYEFPTSYFEALIDDAANRYEKISQFFQSMLTYSDKCEGYIKVLQYLSDDLAKPPSTLLPETYRNLAKLRRNIFCLEVKLVERRDLAAANFSSPSLEHHSGTVERKDTAVQTSPITIVVEAGSENKPKLCAQEMCNVQPSTFCPHEKLQLQQKTKLVEEKLGARLRRRNAVNEYYRQFTAAISAVVSKPLRSQGTPKVKRRFISPPAVPKPSEVNTSIYNPSSGGSKAKPNIRVNKVKPKKLQCLFCKGHHWSHLCMTVPTLKLRQKFFLTNQLCTLCGKNHVGICRSYRIVCQWPQCGAQYVHHSALCPDMQYPITIAHTKAYKAAIMPKNCKYLSKPVLLEQVPLPIMTVSQSDILNEHSLVTASQQPAPKRLC